MLRNFYDCSLKEEWYSLVFLYERIALEEWYYHYVGASKSFSTIAEVRNFGIHVMINQKYYPRLGSWARTTYGKPQAHWHS
jgi:hypothetical protein